MKSQNNKAGNNLIGKIAAAGFNNFLRKETQDLSMSQSGRRDRRGPSLSLPSGSSSNSNDGIIARLSNSVRQSLVFHKSKRAASNTARFSKKVLWSTGKAAWIAGTTFLVLVVPLIIEMDREQQLTDLETQQASLLGAPPSPLP